MTPRAVGLAAAWLALGSAGGCTRALCGGEFAGGGSVTVSVEPIREDVPIWPWSMTFDGLSVEDLEATVDPAGRSPNWRPEFPDLAAPGAFLARYPDLNPYGHERARQIVGRSAPETYDVPPAGPGTYTAILIQGWRPGGALDLLELQFHPAYPPWNTPYCYVQVYDGDVVRDGPSAGQLDAPGQYICDYGATIWPVNVHAEWAFDDAIHTNTVFACDP